MFPEARGAPAGRRRLSGRRCAVAACRHIVIDGSRFVSSLKFSKRYSELPYLTLRASFMAGEFFDADFITVACLPEHQAFYRRMFGATLWCDASGPIPSSTAQWPSSDTTGRPRPTLSNVTRSSPRPRTSAKLCSSRSSNLSATCSTAIGRVAQPKRALMRISHQRRQRRRRTVALALLINAA